MEMEKVPALGYRIVGLPIAGLQRRMDWHNLAVPLKVLRSIRMAKKTIRDFGADAVVGFGGYASAPVLWAAQRLGVPTVIQEQNSYAGLTNKILARRAQRICVAYEGMDRFFAPGKITMTGNPLRGRFSKEGADRGEALAYYGFRAELPVVLVVGGSLGTRSLNEMMKAWILSLGGADAPVQVIWQTGKYYEREMQAFLAAHPTGNIWQGAFIDRMDYAYAGPTWSCRAAARNGLGVVSGGQARVVRAFAQRGRGSPDEERPGAGGQGGCGGGARCRGPHAGDGAGDGAARQRGGIAQDERKPREAGATRRGGADRG